ncbi:MAG: HNH endonuclease, partial [Clostridium sp.]|nr:HNH endonuclease [Clostridium sp.]
MPRKPKHPCAYPGCSALTDGRYCEKHAHQANSEYEKYGRDRSTKLRYGHVWKRIRDRYAAEHPFCELCFARG